MNRGQVVQKGNAKWLVRVYRGRVEGKRKYVAQLVHGSRKDAEAVLTSLLAHSDSRELPVPSTVTVGEFLGRWLKSRVDLREKTRRDYEYLLRLNVLPTLRALPLQKLHTQHLQDLYGSLFSDRELSPRTIQYVHAVVRSALQCAREQNLIRWNPADLAKLPKMVRKEMAALSPSQVKEFLEATKSDRLGSLWRMLLTTGLRPSEALALQWRDLDGEWLTVRRAVAAEGLMDEGKTEGATRKISVPSQLQFALEMRRGLPEEFIWATRTGNYMDLSTVRKEWKKALAKAGLPMVRLYDARHTHLSQLLAAGVNVKAVAHRAGHSNPTVLLRTYAHVLPEVERESARIIENLLEVA